MRWLALVGVVTAVACSHDHGPPRVRARPPKPDPKSPALRGDPTPRTSRIASYKIDSKLDPVRHVITATETLTWLNTGDSAVDTLPFHLYLNAFKNETTLFMRTSRGVVRRAQASDNGWGWINVDSVQYEGTELITALKPTGPDETVAELTLPTPVEAHASAVVTFKFTAQLPEVFARTGYKGDFTMVGQWFPKIGVRVGIPGAERWECLPFDVNSEFFADFGTYDVTLTVPATHIVAATGVLVGVADIAGGLRTFTYRAEDVHDFAWMADPYMEVESRPAKLEGGGKVDVSVVFRPEQREFAERHLDAAIGAVEKFSALYVPYPWSTLTVIDPPVDAADGAGGMEYPTLVTTSGDTVLARPGIRLPEYTTIHEVGHNWFQGMLASNEPEEPWLDEGVNEWADAVVMAELYGPRGSAIDWYGWQAELAAFERALADDPMSLPSPIATAAYAFVDEHTYGMEAYLQTQRALRTLELTVGASKFAAAMKVYAQEFAFKHPTGRDLYATLERELGMDLSWFFGPVFHQVGGLDLSVRDATCARAHKPRGVFDDKKLGKKTVTETEAPDAATWNCEVTVQNTGVVHVPVDVELRFADGMTQRERWDDRGEDGAWTRFSVQRGAKLVEVKLDPDDKLLLAAPLALDFRLEGDGGASLRAASRISTWAQAAMQLVGP